MFRIIASFIILLLLMTSCEEATTNKPPHLISRDKMVGILVDIHLSDAAFQVRRYSSEKMKKFNESDIYYSVLRKHHIADSIFEKSLIYYSGNPKEYEKIYTRVINRLTEMEQEESKKKEKPVNLEKPQ
jgi:transposase-like protein